jgi:hypothetical protein
MKLPHHVTIKYLVVHCRKCRQRHFADDVVELVGVLTCKRTGCQVMPLEQPIPIHIHQFSRFRVTVRERVVLEHGALRAGSSFLLEHPQIVERCLQVSTKQYGVVAIPVSALEMVPVVEKRGAA